MLLRGDVWRCGAREVVRAIRGKHFEMFKNLFPRCHDEIVRRATEHWVSSISWTVRNLCSSRDGTTWLKLYMRHRHLDVFTDFVPLKCHDLARHIAGHCGNEIRASVRLAWARHGAHCNDPERLRASPLAVFSSDFIQLLGRPSPKLNSTPSK